MNADEKKVYDSTLEFNEDLLASNTLIEGREVKLKILALKQLAALKKARETIRIWHGEVAWSIYDGNSPEMKEFNAAIAEGEALLKG